MLTRADRACRDCSCHSCGVLGVMIVVLIGHDEVLVIYVSIFVVIFCNWRCTLYTTDMK